MLVAATQRAQAVHDLLAGSVCAEPAARARLQGMQVPLPPQVAPPAPPLPPHSPIQQDDEPAHRGPFL